MAERPFYTRLAFLGLGLYFLTIAIYAVGIVIGGDFSEAGFLIFFAIPGLIVLAALYFIKPWGVILGLIGGVFGILALSDGADISLSSPQSFFDFVGTLLSLTGVILVAIGSGVSVYQLLRHSGSEQSGQTTRMVVKGVLGVIAVLSVVSLVLTVAGLGGVSAADEQGATILTAHKTKYDLDSITAKSNGTTKVVIKNKDPILHTFTVDGLDVDVKVGPGSEKLVEFKSPPAGTYVFHCKISGHEDMKGTFTVQ